MTSVTIGSVAAAMSDVGDSAACGAPLRTPKPSILLLCRDREGGTQFGLLVDPPPLRCKLPQVHSMIQGHPQRQSRAAARVLANARGVPADRESRHGGGERKGHLNPGR